MTTISLQHHVVNTRALLTSQHQDTHTQAARHILQHNLTTRPTTQHTRHTPKYSSLASSTAMPVLSTPITTPNTHYPQIVVGMFPHISQALHPTTLGTLGNPWEQHTLGHNTHSNATHLLLQAATTPNNHLLTH